MVGASQLSSELVASTFSLLRPWQPDLVRKSLAGLQSGNFLNGSDMGVGKTYTAVATAKILNKRLLAVCRLGAKGTWPEVAGRFGIADRVTAINRESLRTGKTEFGHWELGEANHNTGKREKLFRWTLPPDTLLVYDEIHWEGGLSSLNSKMLIAAVRQGVKILGLSGTAADDPRKMRAIGFMLGLHRDYDFDRWLYQHGADKEFWNCGLSPSILGSSQGKTILENKRREQMARIHSRMTDLGRFARVTKAEIPNFPRCVVEPTAIDFGSDQLRVILDEMNAELARLKSRGTRQGQREIMMRARQKAELIQVPGLVDEVRAGIDDGQSPAVFVNFTETVRALADRLKTDCVYTGKESAEVRERNRLRYQNDESRVIVVNSAAGSESIGLQDIHGNYPRLGLVIPSFHAVTLNQLLGRLPRDGSKTISTYRILFARGTVEEQAYLACKAKTERIGIFNGDIQFTDSDLTAGLHL